MERLLKYFRDKSDAVNKKPNDSANSNNMKSLTDYQDMLDKKFK